MPLPPTTPIHTATPNPPATLRPLKVKTSLVFIRAIRRTVALSAVLLVCACFESDRPLLKPSDIATPLPSRFFLLSLEKNGKIKLDDSGKPTENNITLSGSTYIDDTTKQSYKIGKLDDDYLDRRIFILQIEFDKEKFKYGLITVKAEGLTLYLPPTGNVEEGKSALVAALRSAGVKFSDTGSVLQFDDSEQLLAAGRVYAKTLNFDHEITYRVVDKDKPDDVARLAYDLARAKEAQAQLSAQTQPKAEIQVQFQAYSHPKLFDAIYRGDADPRRMIDLDIIFLQEFLQRFFNSNDCNNLVSRSTLILITAKAEGAAFRNQTKDLIEDTRRRRLAGPSSGPIDFGKVFNEGARLALGPLVSGAEQIDNAEKDSRLFASEYGCNTAIANRFFENMGLLVTKL